MRTKTFLPALLASIVATALCAQDTGNEFAGLAKIRIEVKSRRVGSYDRTGGNGDNMAGIPDGAKVDIMNVKGPGIIRHIWITLAPGADKLDRNNVIIRMYWDGNPFPSVESPIGPFFGNGWGEAYNFVSAPLAVTPGWGKSYVSYFAMPFATGARIEIETRAARKSTRSTSTSTTTRSRASPPTSAASTPGITTSSRPRCPAARTSGASSARRATISTARATTSSPTSRARATSSV